MNKFIAALKKISRSIMMLGLCAIPQVSQGYFQDMAYGVRPAGMGEAFVAVADDANTMLVNPAGLAAIEQIELMGMYADLYSNFNARLYTGQYDRTGYNLLAAVVPISAWQSGLGISWRQFYSTFYKENVFSLGYGVRLWPAQKLDIGLSLKGMQWLVEANDFTTDTSLFPYNSRSKSGLSGDVGLTIEPLPRLKVGLAWDNLIPVDMGLTTTEIVPAILRLGVGYQIQVSHPFIDKLDLAAEVTGRDLVWVPKFGLEAWVIRRVLALRTGLSSERMTAGMSYRQGLPQRALSLQVDYAYAYSFSIPDNWGSHRIGLTLGWSLAAIPRVGSIQKKGASHASPPTARKTQTKPAPTVTPTPVSREQAIEELLNDPDYLQFKKFMEYQAFIAAQAETKVTTKKDVEKTIKKGKKKAPATKKAKPVKIIKHLEDRIIIGVETKSLTDLWSIQDVLKIINQLKINLENKTNIVLQLKRFNSFIALQKAFLRGQVDVIVRDTRNHAKTCSPDQVQDLMTVDKEGQQGTPYVLISRDDDARLATKNLQGLRLGYVLASDLEIVRQQFGRLLKGQDLRKTFRAVIQYESTRACLLALQMKEVDVMVVLQHALNMVRHDQQAMLKGTEIIATSKLIEPFAPLSIRTTLSENKINKIMILLKAALTMHHESQNKLLLKRLGFDKLLPISKQGNQSNKK